MAKPAYFYSYGKRKRKKALLFSRDRSMSSEKQRPLDIFVKGAVFSKTQAKYTAGNMAKI
jgi:hypothetical protein